MPIDTLGEILSYLHPPDLLSLSRTSKPLRCLLMNSSSKAYWSAALAGLDLPPCPNDMSEPLFVEMMFSQQPYCFTCKRGDRDVFICMEARTRLCDKCGLKEFKFWHLLPSRDIESALTHIIPMTHARLAKNEKNQQEHYPELCNDWRNKRRARFHVATAEMFDREFRALRKPNDRTAWLERRQLEHQEKINHAKSCERFWEARRLEEERRLAEIRNLRAAQIEERLGSLGWVEEIRVSDRFVLREHDLVAVDRPLTETEWDDIKPELEASLEQLRAKRAAQLREIRIGERIRNHIQPAYNECIIAQLPNPLVPLLPEVVLMDDFLTILGSTPPDHDIPEGAFDDAIAKLPRLISSWRESLDKALLDILQRSAVYPGQERLKAVLGYASTIFKCRGCKAPLSYPNVLAHECFYRTPVSRWADRRRFGSEGANKRELFVDQANETTADLILENYPLFSLWEPGSFLTFHDAAHQHTVSLLDLLGLDRTTTYDEMLERNPYVECLCKCFHRGGGGKKAANVMRWTRALYECANHRSDNYEGSFAAAEEDDLKGCPGYHQAPGRLQRTTTCPLCRKASGSAVGHLTTATSYGHNLSPEQEVLMRGVFFTEDSFRSDHILLKSK